MSTSSTVDIEYAPGSVVLTINRPAQRNALDPTTYAALVDAMSAADRSPDIHAIVLTGAAGHFTAGNDLRAFQAGTPGEARAGIKFLHALADVETPVIAAVEGYAIGIGVTLLQHCDMVYVAENATLRMPFVNLGLCPEGASSFLLPQIVGARRATDWLLTGRPFDGREAVESGLATAVTPPGKSLEAAQSAATQLANLPRDALRLTKALLRAPHKQAVSDTLDVEARHFAERLNTPDAQQAFAAFFRKPPR